VTDTEFVFFFTKSRILFFSKLIRYWRNKTTLIY